MAEEGGTEGLTTLTVKPQNDYLTFTSRTEALITHAHAWGAGASHDFILF